MMQIIRRNNQQSAFTLIELSIVVVVIALIVAGVVAGQSIVKQAKLRDVINQQQQHKVAIRTFQLQYSALPGDFSDAVAFFGATTADGDKDGIIGDSNSSSAGEELRFWQHLALSKIIVGNYTGVDAGNPNSQIGINIPKSSISNAGYILNHWTVNKMFTRVGHSVALAHELVDTNWLGAVISPIDAHSIDQKADDGFPALGTIFSDNASTGTGSCASEGRTFTGDMKTVEYDLNNTEIKCRMHFWFD